MGIFIAIGVILLVYQFVIRPANAKKDGIRMAEVVCGCEIAKTNALINRLQDFDRNFATYNFQIQSEARVAYNNLLSNQTLACEAGVKALTEQNMLQYYYQNEQLYSYYQDGFNQGSQSCGNVQERDRLKNQIEQRINYLPVELPNQTVATSENTFRTALGYNTGTLIIEASVLNVRDRPHKEEGSVVFKVQNGEYQPKQHRSGQRSPDGAFAASQKCATDDDGCDGKQFPSDALNRLSSPEL